jgi:hypothetical protein
MIRSDVRQRGKRMGKGMMRERTKENKEKEKRKWDGICKGERKQKKKRENGGKKSCGVVGGLAEDEEMED